MVKVIDVVKSYVLWRRARSLYLSGDWVGAYEACKKSTYLAGRHKNVHLPINLVILMITLSYRNAFYDLCIEDIAVTFDRISSRYKINSHPDMAYLITYMRDLLEYIAGESPEHKDRALGLALNIGDEFRSREIDVSDVSEEIRSLFPIRT